MSEMRLLPALLSAVALVACGHDTPNPEPPCSMDLRLSGAIELEYAHSGSACVTGAWSEAPGYYMSWAIPRDDPTVAVGVVVADMTPREGPGEYDGKVTIQDLDAGTVRYWEGTCTMTIRENRPETDDPSDGRFRVRGSAVCSEATSSGVDEPIQIEKLSFSFQSYAD